MSLYPVFEIPPDIEDVIEVQQDVKSAYFDFQKGDFVLSGAGKMVQSTEREAWIQWCLKAIFTQRYSYYAYSSNMGIEIEEAMNEPDRKAQESALQRTITEALLADPYGRTAYVRNFVFRWQADSVYIECTVGHKDGTEDNIQVTL